MAAYVGSEGWISDCALDGGPAAVQSESLGCAYTGLMALVSAYATLMTLLCPSFASPCFANFEIAANLSALRNRCGRTSPGFRRYLSPTTATYRQVTANHT